MCGTPLDTHPRRRFVDCILNSPTDVSKHYVSLSANGSNNVRPLHELFQWTVAPSLSSHRPQTCQSPMLGMTMAIVGVSPSRYMYPQCRHDALRTRSNDPFLLCRQRHQLPMLSRTSARLASVEAHLLPFETISSGGGVSFAISIKNFGTRLKYQSEALLPHVSLIGLAVRVTAHFLFVFHVLFRKWYEVFNRRRDSSRYQLPSLPQVLQDAFLSEFRKTRCFQQLFR